MVCYKNTDIEIKEFDLVYDTENKDYGILTKSHNESGEFIDDDHVWGIWFPNQDDYKTNFNLKTKKWIVNAQSYSYANLCVMGEIEDMKFIKRLLNQTWKERFTNQ